MRVIRNYEKEKAKTKNQRQKRLGGSRNSDSQAVLVYYEIGSVENFDAIVWNLKLYRPVGIEVKKND